jgi:hypothetical protein
MARQDGGTVRAVNTIRRPFFENTFQEGMTATAESMQ